MAREIGQCIEPPTFDLRRRSRHIRASGSITEVLDQAKTTLLGGASHETALRQLSNTLEELRITGGDTLQEQIEIGYLKNLADSLCNLHTLLRYESAARNFVRIASTAIEQHGTDNIDWRTLVNSALADRQDGSAPDLVAINSVLDYLGIDLHILQRASAPASAFTYAEIVSTREIGVAADILRMQQKALGDDYHLANVAIRLLALHPLRWDSVAHLRLYDFALENTTPHLVITEESGADLKSDNAFRVILLNDENLVRDLQCLADLRLSRFPNDKLVPIFGDVNNPRTIETTTRIHELITDALWRATGSPQVCVHDLRHRVITDRIHTILAPGAHLKFDTLALRQGLIECAVEAGQSWPEVSMENYGHDIERLRAQHVHRLLATLAPPADKFVSGITRIPKATLRKRRSRNPAYTPDLAEGFQWANVRHGAAIVPLCSLVASGQAHVPLAENAPAHESLTPYAAYTGLRLLGESIDVALLICRLIREQVTPLEQALVTAHQRLGAGLKARNDINRQSFLEAVQDSDLAVAMSVLHPDRSSVARIEQSLKQAGSEWAFASPRDALDLAPWIQIWKANGIACELLLRPSSRSVIDSNILAQARKLGFSRARTVPARHFRRNIGTLLRFYQISDTATSPIRPRASSQTAFLVGTCALAFYYFTSGGQHGKNAQTT